MRKSSWALLLVGILLAASIGAEAVQYRIIELQSPSGYSFNGMSLCINNNGDVCGTVGGNGSNYPVIWRNGIAEIVGDYANAQMCAMNSDGQLAITNGYTSTIWHDGAATQLPPPGTGGYCRALSINSSGNVAGFYQGINDECHAFVSNGSNINLLCTNYSCAWDVSDNGEAVGYSRSSPGSALKACAWKDMETEWLDDLDSRGISCAVAVNNSGQIAGYSQIGDPFRYTYHAMLWDDGAVIDIGTLDGDSSQAVDVNSKAQIVGFATDTNGGYCHAFVWQDGVMTDLGSGRSYGINDNGWIVGSTYDSDGLSHIVIWQPVPEPSSILAMLCGIGGIGGAIARRSIR